MGPLIERLSPSLSPCIYLDALPWSYRLIRNVSSPFCEEGDIGVYGRMIDLPLSSLSASGSLDFTTTHEATGRSDASLLGISNTNLRAHYTAVTRYTTRI